MNAKVASDVDIDFHVDLESNPSWGEVEVEVEVNWKPGYSSYYFNLSVQSQYKRGQGGWTKKKIYVQSRSIISISMH